MEMLTGATKEQRRPLPLPPTPPPDDDEFQHSPTATAPDEEGLYEEPQELQQCIERTKSDSTPPVST